MFTREYSRPNIFHLVILVRCTRLHEIRFFSDENETALSEQGAQAPCYNRFGGCYNV